MTVSVRWDDPVAGIRRKLAEWRQQFADWRTGVPLDYSRYGPVTLLEIVENHLHEYEDDHFAELEAAFGQRFGVGVHDIEFKDKPRSADAGVQKIIDDVLATAAGGAGLTSQTEPDAMLTREDVARLTAYHVSTIDCMTECGEFVPSYKVGKNIGYKARDVARWLEIHNGNRIQTG